MMKKKILPLLLGTFLAANFASAQETDSVSVERETTEEETAIQEEIQLQDLGKFNYGYFRLSFLRPLGNFNNPMQGASFAGAANFPYQDPVPNGILTLGIESGRVRHFKKLNLGSPMLKLGINSGFGIHALGPKTLMGTNYEVRTNGTYILRLGLGPQLTFKPIPEVRVGLYYRANLGLAYSSYWQYSYYGPAEDYYDELLIQALNLGYNGDLGIEASWNMLSVGISYSHMRARVNKGQIINTSELIEGANTYIRMDESGDELTVPVNPKLRYHRLALSVGITF